MPDIATFALFQRLVGSHVTSELSRSEDLSPRFAHELFHDRWYTMYVHHRIFGTCSVNAVHNKLGNYWDIILEHDNAPLPLIVVRGAGSLEAGIFAFGGLFCSRQQSTQT